MKKLFTLLLLTITAFTFKSFAKTNGDCNAAFDFSITNLSVNFTQATTTIVSGDHNYWMFGDGAVSSDVSPTHVYASAGTYTVKHYFYKASNTNTAPLCIDSVIKQVTLTAPVISCNLHANFSFQRDSVQTNSVKFTNLSTPAGDIKVTKWAFGDGSYSYDFNTSHVFTTSGLYTVCLTILNSTNTATACIRDTCVNIQVQVPAPSCNINPDYTWRVDSTNFNKIFFTNTTTPITPNTSVIWFFGDSASSTLMNPDHTFPRAGTYNVCLRVSSSSSCYKYMCKTIEIKQPPLTCNLVAGFTWHADSANLKKVFFTNTSTSAAGSNLSIQWNFGDGTKSSLLNPDHTYAQPGTYNVCIRIAIGTTCYKELCKTIEVKGNEINCNDISKFDFTISTANCLEFKFVPVNINANWQYHWSFGDGTGSNDLSPSHVYQHSGNYTVYLTVYRSSSCVSTSYKIAATGTCFSCSNIWVKYEYGQTSASGNISFHALSNVQVLSQIWTITNLSVSGSAAVILNQNNPEYLFSTPGEYLVCLKATTQGGCVKEYCEVVHIAASTVCTLSSYPNPAHTQVSISVQISEPQMIHLYIYNSLNILVKQVDKQGSTGNNTVTTSIESLVPEWYTIRVVYGNKVCYSRFQKI